MPVTDLERRERTVRRKLKGEDLKPPLNHKLWKVREDSRWYAQYGPYAIKDGHGAVTYRGLVDIEAAEEAAAELRRRHRDDE